MSAQGDYKVDRTGWAAGPWDGEPDRIDFIHAGFACFALRHDRFGHWCGYCGVPREHPAYGVKPDDVAVDIHGGVTYANRCNEFICHTPQPGMPDDVWWLGCDFGHAFDQSPGMDAREARMGLSPIGSDLETYRTLPYVRQQIESLAEQLAAMQQSAPTAGRLLA